MTAPVLTTERLLMRMLTVDDFDEYADIHMDPDVTRYTARFQYTRLEAWRHLAMIVGHWQLRGYGMWGLFERETNRLVGRAGFYNPDTWPRLSSGGRSGRSSGGMATRPRRRSGASSTRSKR